MTEGQAYCKSCYYKSESFASPSSFGESCGSLSSFRIFFFTHGLGRAAVSFARVHSPLLVYIAMVMYGTTRLKYHAIGYPLDSTGGSDLNLPSESDRHTISLHKFVLCLVRGGASKETVGWE